MFDHDLKKILGTIQIIQLFLKSKITTNTRMVSVFNNDYHFKM